MLRVIKSFSLCYRHSLFVAAFIGFFFTALSHASTPPLNVTAPVATPLSNVLTKVMPAIVNIAVVGERTRGATDKNNPDADDEDSGPTNDNSPQQAPSPPKQGQDQGSQRFEGTGSGVIINASKGYIVTNAHILRDTRVVTVGLADGRRFKAKVVGVDTVSDIAIIRINAAGLTQLAFGDSDKLEVGELVAAIGNPFGLQQTVTTGVVSALRRSGLGIDGLENFIQTDASINPGNSGGALINMKGYLIGINTALIGPVNGNVGIGLAIPSNMVKLVADELVKEGKVSRGLLGIFVQDLTPELADAMNISGKKGALISNVMPGSPAQKAGLEVQDVVLGINDIEITTGTQLRNIVGLLPLKSKLSIRVLRKDKLLTVNAIIISPQELKKATEPGLSSSLEGVRLTSYDELNPNFGLVKGVVVLDVDETSDAWISGLRAGDMVLSVNGQVTPNLEALLNLVKQDNKHLLIKVARGGGIMFLVLNQYS